MITEETDRDKGRESPETVMPEARIRWILGEQFKLPEQHGQRPCGRRNRAWHFSGPEGWPVWRLKGKILVGGSVRKPPSEKDLEVSEDARGEGRSKAQELDAPRSP